MGGSALPLEAPSLKGIMRPLRLAQSNGFLSSLSLEGNGGIGEGDPT